MRLIDADHLRKWILARWQETNPYTDRPFRADEILAQIDREFSIEMDRLRGEWIPCSERLPEPNRHDELNVDVYYLAQTEFGDMIVASYNESHEGTKWWEQMYSYRIFDDEIVAWRPLPEPYKRGDTHD